MSEMVETTDGWITVAERISELESRVRELEAERDKERNAVFDLSEQLTSLEAERDRLIENHTKAQRTILKLRARHAALVEAAEKSNQTFYKMLHHFDGNLDYPKEYRKYIDQLSSELKAALDIKQEEIKRLNNYIDSIKPLIVEE